MSGAEPKDVSEEEAAAAEEELETIRNSMEMNEGEIEICRVMRLCANVKNR